jgi:hypothetical protein
MVLFLFSLPDAIAPMRDEDDPHFTLLVDALDSGYFAGHIFSAFGFNPADLILSAKFAL